MVALEFEGRCLAGLQNSSSRSGFRLDSRFRGNDNQGIHCLALSEESFGLVLKDCASSRPGGVENSFLKPYPPQQVLEPRV
jgi:hypothetical protein